MLTTEFYPAIQPDSKRLLLALHGLGDSAAGYRWLPAILRLPWLNYLLANAPDSYYGGYSWYDFADDPLPGIQRSRRLLFSLLDRMGEQGFAPGQIVLLGFSQGCLMAWEAGLRYPHGFAGVVGISGYVHDPGQALRELSPVARQQSFLITHGTEDPLIPIAGVRAQVAQLRAAGLHIQWHEFAKPHTIAGEPEIELIRKFIQVRFDQPA